MKVINIPRIGAEKWLGPASGRMERLGSVHEIYEQIGDKCAWISIGEPEPQFVRTTNLILDSKPNLKLEFWDLDKPIEMGDETLNPPSDEDAKQIVDFIVANKGKNIVVNCAAGVSRSGAVCRFCEDILGYEWLSFGKKLAIPNAALYSKMLRYYLREVRPHMEG